MFLSLELYYKSTIDFDQWFFCPGSTNVRHFSFDIKTKARFYAGPRTHGSTHKNPQKRTKKHKIEQIKNPQNL